MILNEFYSSDSPPIPANIPANCKYWMAQDGTQGHKHINASHQSCALHHY